jgi:hypothetical protein
MKWTLDMPMNYLQTDKQNNDLENGREKDKEVSWIPK